MRNKYLVGILIIVIIFFNCCTKQNEEFFQKQTVINCDTAHISFTSNVLPIFKTNCFSCHGNGNNLGGVTLDTYAEIKFQSLNHDLLQVINHVPGYSEMPQLAPKLSKCDIDRITSWINLGAPNN